MSRFSAAWRSAGAGSTTLPIGSLFATASVRPRVAEVGVFNTTVTAVAIALRRATAVGTAGSAISKVYEDDDVQASVATPFDTHTVTPTFVAGNIRVASLGAAVGSGVIWTFPLGLEIPPGTGNGLLIVPLVGTGQICDISITWDE
jgi:hypothetical protein